MANPSTTGNKRVVSKQYAAFRRLDTRSEFSIEITTLANEGQEIVVTEYGNTTRTSKPMTVDDFLTKLGVYGVEKPNTKMVQMGTRKPLPEPNYPYVRDYDPIKVSDFCKRNSYEISPEGIYRHGDKSYRVTGYRVFMGTIKSPRCLNEEFKNLHVMFNTDKPCPTSLILAKNWATKEWRPELILVEDTKKTATPPSSVQETQINSYIRKSKPVDVRKFLIKHNYVQDGVADLATDIVTLEGIEYKLTGYMVKMDTVRVSSKTAHPGVYVLLQHHFALPLHEVKHTDWVMSDWRPELLRVSPVTQPATKQQKTAKKRVRASRCPKCGLAPRLVWRDKNLKKGFRRFQCKPSCNHAVAAYVNDSVNDLLPWTYNDVARQKFFWYTDTTQAAKDWNDAKEQKNKLVLSVLEPKS